MTDFVIIHFSRPGKSTTRYTEGLLDDNPMRIKTLTYIPADTSMKWCEENLWPKGYIPRSILIRSVLKYLFYREWFSVMQVLDKEGANLGYYVDIVTPFRKVGGQFYLSDLFLDLWIAPDGTFSEQDRDEFEAGFHAKLITPYQHRKACQTIGILKTRVANGDFFQMLR